MGHFETKSDGFSLRLYWSLHFAPAFGVGLFLPLHSDNSLDANPLSSSGAVW
jgi:hypothetical protein